MTIITWRTRLTFLLGVTLVAVVLTLAFAGPGAGASPTARGGKPPAAGKGDNGTVKIHRSTTPVSDPRNEPHVCVFYLDAFGFDPGQSVSWQIKSWPPTGDRAVVSSGTLALGGNGGGFTGDMTLPNGHYKLYWNFTGEHGFAKQKVFWVACPAPTPSPTPTPTSSPSGSPTPSPSGSPTPSSSSPSPSVSPTTTSTATPPPSQAPTPGPSSSPPSQGGLPTTGGPLALIAAAGVALLGTGGTAIVAARRRRRLPGR
ncbi:MAG TPA: hypothetical protein VGQ26_17815 [Streptosporangiaceae bacterium]|jgi:hypothetical protein|nr:hypothetical protein [Streptosporangiaceae bacterium]